VMCRDIVDRCGETSLTLHFAFLDLFVISSTK